MVGLVPRPSPHAQKKNSCACGEGLGTRLTDGLLHVYTGVHVGCISLHGKNEELFVSLAFSRSPGILSLLPVFGRGERGEREREHHYDYCVCMCIFRESVDSLCRDGTDTPFTQYKIKLSKSLQKITFIGAKPWGVSVTKTTPKVAKKLR